MIIFKYKHDYLIVIIVLLSLYYLINDYKTDQESIKIDEKNETKIKNSNDYIKEYLGELEIPIINFKKNIIKSNEADLQKKIDKNNIVTLDDDIVDSIVVYGHYTQVRNYVLNRIYEVKIKDRVIIRTPNDNIFYKVVEYGKIKDINDLDVSDDKRSIIIVTCTKEFSEVEKYYVKAREI